MLILTVSHEVHWQLAFPQPLRPLHSGHAAQTPASPPYLVVSAFQQGVHVLGHPGVAERMKLRKSKHQRCTGAASHWIRCPKTRALIAGPYQLNSTDCCRGSGGQGHKPCLARLTPVGRVNQ